jgi:hypothetical protein
VVHIMMRTILGSAIGGLVAAAVALGASAHMRSAPAPAYAPEMANPYAMTVANTTALSQGGALQCQAFQEPVVRRAIVGGREVAEVICATRMEAGIGTMTPAYAQSEFVSMPVRQAPAVSRRAAVRPRTVPRESEPRDERSWGKTAMIIGGGSGAGAGIGGLIGGKKGALIGAAIGGGAATIYESTRR